MTKEECLEALDTIGFFVHVSDPINGLAVSEADLFIKELIEQHFELKEKHEKATERVKPKKLIKRKTKFDSEEEEKLYVEVFGEEQDFCTNNCPICNQILTVSFRYCPYCGEPIDWSDVRE